MVNNEYVQTLKALEARLIARAMNEKDFRARLLADPRAAVAEECGKSLPRSLKVQVLEQPVDQLTLVLPAAIPATGDLGDKELDMVTGGFWAELKQFLGLEPPPKEDCCYTGRMCGVRG